MIRYLVHNEFPSIENAALGNKHDQNACKQDGKTPNTSQCSPNTILPIKVQLHSYKSCLPLILGGYFTQGAQFPASPLLP